MQLVKSAILYIKDSSYVQVRFHAHKFNKKLKSLREEDRFRSRLYFSSCKELERYYINQFLLVKIPSKKKLIQLNEKKMVNNNFVNNINNI